MIGSLRREIFGHWLAEEEEEPPQLPSTSKGKVDLRQFLNEPGALKELTSFFKAIKEAEKEDDKKKKSKPKPKPRAKPKKD
jgi:hypothetical protein